MHQFFSNIKHCALYATFHQPMMTSCIIHKCSHPNSSTSAKTYGILSTDAKIADRKYSVVSCKHCIECLIRSQTASCCRATSGVTSYGK